MKLKPLKPKQHKKAARVFWVLFPFLGFWLVWRLFQFLLGRHRFYSIKHKRRPKKLLGLAAFTTLIFFKRKWFYLKYFAIAPDSQGQGVGSQTLHKIEAKARRQKHDYFLLLSSPWRTKAHQFYFKKGFKRWLGFIFFKKLK